MVLLNSTAFPEAVKKYKVSSFPHLVVVRKDKKDEVYKGAFEFQKLFDWLNVFSETFVMGGGFSDTAPAAEFDPELQPWYVIIMFIMVMRMVIISGTWVVCRLRTASWLS